MDINSKLSNNVGVILVSHGSTLPFAEEVFTEIKEKVVVQAGCTKYESKNMEIFDLIPMEKFDDLIKSCDLLITHGGVGSIITGLKNNKKVIAAARLEKYKEHTNDHQKHSFFHY